MARSFVSALNSNGNLAVSGFPGTKGASLQSGSTSTALVLDAAAQSTNNYYTGLYIKITSGDANGNVAQILHYDGTTKIASVKPALAGGAPGTDTYDVFGYSGIVAGCTHNTITLDPTASSTDGFYTGAHIHITLGVGRGQVRHVIAYNGTTKILTVDEHWEVSPTLGATYAIHGEGGVAVAATNTTIQLSAGASTITGYYNGLWVELTSTGLLADRRKVRLVSSYDGPTQTATLANEWGGSVSGSTPTYRIFGGWGGAFEEVADYHTMTCTVNAPEGDIGGLETIFSPTSSGLNPSNVDVEIQYDNTWGNVLAGDRLGPNAHSRAIESRYVRMTVVTYGAGFTGGLTTKFSSGKDPSTTHLVDEQIGDTAECTLSRSLITGKVEGGGSYRNIHTTPNGELAVALPLTSFGELRVAELTPQFQVNAVGEIGDQELVSFFGGAQSTVRHEVSRYVMRIGDSPITPAVAVGDYAVFRTKKIARYRPGFGGMLRFTATFNTPNNFLWQFAGLATGGNALEFGYFSDYTDGGVVKFGLNRSSGGRVPIRTLEITNAPDAGGTITLVLPDFPVSPGLGGTAGSGNDVTYTVELVGGETTQEVAYKIATTADDGSGGTWADHKWDVQEVDSHVVFRGVGVGARASATYTFTDTDTTNAAAGRFHRVQQGIALVQPEVREINVTTGCSTNNNIQISLNGAEAVTITLDSATHNTAKKVAWIIANTPTWSTHGSGWVAEVVGEAGTRVRFTALIHEVRNGVYAYTEGGSGAAIDLYLNRETGVNKKDNWVFQENWNVDRCDGTGPSQFFLVPQKGNVYSITYQYLGYGAILYQIENPKTGKFIPVHLVHYAGSSEVTHLENPHMPFQASIYAISDSIPDATYSLSIASWAFMTEGKIEHFAPRFAVDNYQSTVPGGVSETERAMLLLKHPEVDNSSSSQVGVFIRKISVGLDAGSGNVTIINVRINPTLTSRVPRWETVSYPDSPMLSCTSTLGNTGNSRDDIQRMVVSGGVLIATKSSSGDKTYEIDMSNYELNRGEVICISSRAHVDKSDIHVSIEWVEDH